MAEAQQKASDAEFEVMSENKDVKINGTVIAARDKRQSTVGFFLQVSDKAARKAYLYEMFPHHHVGELESDYMDFEAIAQQVEKLEKEKAEKSKEAKE